MNPGSKINFQSLLMAGGSYCMSFFCYNYFCLASPWNICQTLDAIVSLAALYICHSLSESTNSNCVSLILVSVGNVSTHGVLEF